MEILGTIRRKPIQKDGKWDYVHVEFETQEEFNEATSKIMEILYKKNAEGKCYLKDTKGTKYDLDIVHASFNTTDNIISVYPYGCKVINNTTSNDSKNKITNKKFDK